MRTFLGTRVVEYAPPLAVLAVTLVYLATAYGYPPEARAFPETVAWASLLLAGLDLVSRTQSSAGRLLLRWFNPAAAERPGPHSDYPVLAQAIAIGWVVGFVALMWLAGILVAVPFLVFLSMVLRGRFSIGFSLLIAAGATAGLWLVFEQVLMLELHRGLLFGAL